MKTAAERHPLLRRVVKAAGYIPNDHPEALITAGTESLRQGRSLLLFPEGTRSPAGRLGPFHRGAARIALRSGTDLVPVVITCAPPTLMKGQRWYDVPECAAHITLTVKDRVRFAIIRRSADGGRGARDLTDFCRGSTSVGFARAADGAAWHVAEEHFERIRDVMVKTFGLEEEQVTPVARLVDDLRTR